MRPSSRPPIPQAAEQAIEKAAAADEEPERRRSYEGVDYLRGSGRHGRRRGRGLPRRRHRARLPRRGRRLKGESLAESGDFKAQLDRAPDDRVGFVYADPRAILDALQKSGQLSAAEVASARPRLEALLSQPATASISATSDQLALQASAAPAPPRPRRSRRSCGTSRRSVARLRGHRRRRGLRAPAPPGPAGAGSGSAAGRRARLRPRRPDHPLGRGHRRVRGAGRRCSASAARWCSRPATSRPRPGRSTSCGARSAMIRRLSVEPLTDAGEHGFSLTPAGVPIHSRSSSATTRWSPASPTRSATSSRRAPRSTTRMPSTRPPTRSERTSPRSPSSTSCPCSSSSRASRRRASDPDYQQREAVPRPPRLLRARRSPRWRPRRGQDGARAARCAGGDRRGLRSGGGGRGGMSVPEPACRSGHPAGIGIDLLEIGRLERALERRPRLAERLFTDGELAHARSRRRPGRHLAARFAAKEAAVKALGGGALPPREIEVTGGGREAPRLRLHGRAAAAGRRTGRRAPGFAHPLARARRGGRACRSSVGEPAVG